MAPASANCTAVHNTRVSPLCAVACWVLYRLSALFLSIKIVQPCAGAESLQEPRRKGHTPFSLAQHMCDEEWSAMFKAPLARYVPIFEDEALTPTLLRSFRPWPAALHEALRELGVSEEDVPLITAALCPDSSPKPKTAIATAAASV